MRRLRRNRRIHSTSSCSSIRNMQFQCHNSMRTQRWSWMLLPYCVRRCYWRSYRMLRGREWRIWKWISGILGSLRSGDRLSRIRIRLIDWNINNERRSRWSWLGRLQWGPRRISLRRIRHWLSRWRGRHRRGRRNVWNSNRRRWNIRRCWRIRLWRLRGMCMSRLIR